MARLSTKQYLKAHRQLRRLWERDPSLFSYLAPSEQWVLHDFFQLTHEMTDAELLEHRVRISGERPSLPQQAGRTLAKFYDRTAVVATQRVRAKPVTKRSVTRQADRVLAARPLVRPEIDVEKLARAFISLAQQRQRQSDGLGLADPDTGRQPDAA